VLSMKLNRYSSPIHDVPVDFLADPDGGWDYAELVRSAGYPTTSAKVMIGALTEDWCGFPAGAAVVVGPPGATPAFSVIDCRQARVA
jgi:hypothetical protein